MLAVACIGATAGLLIGSVGVGGVIIVPSLVYAVGIPVEDAIASAMLGYILTGLIGTTVYAAKGSIRWRIAGWLCLGATPGVLLGAWVMSMTRPLFLEAGVGLLLIASSLHALVSRSASSAVRESLSSTAIVTIGAVTGFVSALTGTGGPLVLVPVLMYLCLPVLTVVGLSQAVQIPIATAGTAGNLMFGHPHLSVGAVLGVALALGALAGAKLAHVVPRDKLARVTSMILLCVGISILLRFVF